MELDMKRDMSPQERETLVTLFRYSSKALENAAVILDQAQSIFTRMLGGMQISPEALLRMRDTLREHRIALKDEARKTQKAAAAVATTS